MKKNLKMILLILLFFLIVGIIGGFTTYKKETLKCNYKLDECRVIKENYFNIKSDRVVSKYSDVERCGHYLIRVKGNRYAKGYSSYLLTFELKNNKSVEIFKQAYFDKKEFNSVVKKLNKKINNSEDFIYNR